MVDEARPRRFVALKRVLIGLVAVVAVLAIVVAMQPAEFRVVRSAAIPAPPEQVFAQVNDFHHWNDWSPWAKLDPAAKNTFEGASQGTGAIFTWSGNSDIGEGRMEILESRPNELVKINLEFIKPFPSKCITQFTFKPVDDQTSVTWDMNGQNNFVGKAMCLVMDMDKMIGPDFERGLANIKSVVEATSKQADADSPAEE